MLAFLIAIGGFAGVMAGLLRVGGGIVLVPAFYYAFSALGYASDQLMRICLATSLATIIVTSVRSVLAHNKKDAVDWEVLKTWAPGIVIGAIIAVPSAIGFLFVEIAPANRPPYTIGEINLVAFLVIIAMTQITTPWGVKLAHAMDSKPLKRVFAAFLILVALNMLRKAPGW